MLQDRILVDSSFLIALYDRRSILHHDVTESAQLYRDRFVIPQVVLTEVVYLLKRAMGQRGAIAFLVRFTRSRPRLHDLTADDLRHVAEIM
jgi:predicted nucleic acid-binding protein